MVLTTEQDESRWVRNQTDSRRAVHFLHELAERTIKNETYVSAALKSLAEVEGLAWKDYRKLVPGSSSERNGTYCC